MSNTLRNLTGFQRGVELDEVGINIESFEMRIFPEYKEFVANKDGQSRGFAIPNLPSRELTIKGEISNTTGVMAMAFGTPLTLANDIDYFGATTGDFYGDEATVMQGRSEWKSLTMKLTNHPLITGST